MPSTSATAKKRSRLKEQAVVDSYVHAESAVASTPIVSRSKKRKTPMSRRRRLEYIKRQATKQRNEMLRRAQKQQISVVLQPMDTEGMADGVNASQEVGNDSDDDNDDGDSIQGHGDNTSDDRKVEHDEPNSADSSEAVNHQGEIEPGHTVMEHEQVCNNTVSDESDISTVEHEDSRQRQQQTDAWESETDDKDNESVEFGAHVSSPRRNRLEEKESVRNDGVDNEVQGSALTDRHVPDYNGGSGNRDGFNPSGQSATDTGHVDASEMSNDLVDDRQDNCDEVSMTESCAESRKRMDVIGRSTQDTGDVVDAEIRLLISGIFGDSTIDQQEVQEDTVEESVVQTQVTEIVDSVHSLEDQTANHVRHDEQTSGNECDVTDTVDPHGGVTGSSGDHPRAELRDRWTNASATERVEEETVVPPPLGHESENVCNGPGEALRQNDHDDGRNLLTNHQQRSGAACGVSAPTASEAMDSFDSHGGVGSDPRTLADKSANACEADTIDSSANDPEHIRAVYGFLSPPPSATDSGDRDSGKSGDACDTDDVSCSDDAENLLVVDNNQPTEPTSYSRDSGSLELERFVPEEAVTCSDVQQTTDNVEVDLVAGFNGFEMSETAGVADVASLFVPLDEESTGFVAYAPEEQLPPRSTGSADPVTAFQQQVETVESQELSADESEPTDDGDDDVVFVAEVVKLTCTRGPPQQVDRKPDVIDLIEGVVPVTQGNLLVQQDSASASAGPIDMNVVALH